MTHTLDVIAVGNAIVDVLAHTDEAFLKIHEIPKGGMILIDADKAARINDDLKPTDRVAGGSAGNSVACLASLGGSAGFIGKVADDDLGQVYRASMQTMGVNFPTASIEEGIFTGRCLIAVTPDAERSMATFLGAAGEVDAEDVDEDFIASAAVTFFEGYLWEGSKPRNAFVKACDVARSYGRKTALTLSDVGVVHRHSEALIAFIKEHVDILFANEEEARALFGTHEDAASLAAEMSQIVPYGAVTQSENGSMVYGPDGDVHHVAAVAPPQLEDTTGAGDAYAGGYLYGFTRQRPLPECAALGSLAASEVISHMGPRPEKSLHDLAKEHGLI